MPSSKLGTRVVRWVNAGHPAPLMITGGEPHFLEAAGSVPLGVLPFPTYEEVRTAVRNAFQTLTDPANPVMLDVDKNPDNGKQGLRYSQNGMPACCSAATSSGVRPSRCAHSSEATTTAASTSATSGGGMNSTGPRGTTPSPGAMRALRARGGASRRREGAMRSSSAAVAG